jgi:hypothetical protein
MVATLRCLIFLGSQSCIAVFEVPPNDGGLLLSGIIGIVLESGYVNLFERVSN